MPIKIVEPMKREIGDLVKQNDFKWFMLFDLLERRYAAETVMKMLGIGRTSYYDYKKFHNSRYVERKLLEYYNNLE